jgi:hypothetical protein
MLGDLNWYESALVYGFLAVAAGYLFNIGRRVKGLRVQQARLTVTIQKFDIDLEAILGSLLVMSEADPELKEKVRRLRERRTEILRQRVLDGATKSDSMRGLWYPDYDDDPEFWAADRLKKLGLDDERIPDAP